MAKYKTYKKNVQLGAGQQLHYTPGKGYWAGPRVSAPAAPRPPADPYAPTPPAQLATQAGQMANAALAPEKTAIELERQRAAAAAEAARKEILALGQAVGGMTQGIGPGIQAGYAQAAGQLSQIGAGLSGGIAERMTELGGAGVDFARAQGAPVDALGPDVGAMKDVSYGLNAVVPAASLLAQGAAGNAWGQGLSAITAAAVRGDYARAMHEANVQDDQYAKELIAVAAKFPAQRDAALEALRKYELEKAGYKLDLRQQKVQERAQSLYEQQFNEEARGNVVKEQQDQRELRLRERQLVLDRKKYTLDNKQHVQDVKDAQADGRQIDASASKVLGYIVDKQGREVLDRNGKRIPVKEAAKKGGTAEERNPYGAAVEAARTLRGDPVEAPDFVKNAQGKTRPPRGKYLARRGAKGVFPDGTTNDPSRAQFNGQYTFAEAVGFIQARYGISRAQARKALIASGWKPDGQRPKG